MTFLAAVCAVPAGAATSSGVQHLHYRYGPINVRPGENSIYIKTGVPSPKVSGYITRFAPNLRRADGTVPPVDVIHLHHAVWLSGSRRDATAPQIPAERLFAAGEEKTILSFPKGYGYFNDASRRWLLNYMVHNQTSTPEKVWITWDLDYVPLTSKKAKAMKHARPIWMDVQNGSLYPVFDVTRGMGTRGLYTYPDQSTKPYGDGPALNTWKVDRDGVIVVTGGHVHPGGINTDLWLQRPGQARRALLFRSEAHYWEPAGPVSWDMAMTISKPSYRVAIKKGDTLGISATYETDRASWYEGMGIIIAYVADGRRGVDPFKASVATDGQITHGHLPENDNHGGDAGGLPDPLTLLATPPSSGNVVTIDDFTYGQGDLSSLGKLGQPPTISRGQSLTFKNLDAARDIYHSITACREPCNRTPGIAYPVADGSTVFDSGELGFGPPGMTPTANRDTWSTPTDLIDGTYTYFCRIHPFMRGSFRVTG